VMLDIQNRPERVEALIAFNAVRFNVSRGQILRTETQTRQASAARQEIALRLWGQGFSSPQIARWLNYRDHTPILYLLGRTNMNGMRQYQIRTHKAPPDRHPNSFVVLMAGELRKRWATI
jgi:hypothetical protein